MRHLSRASAISVLTIVVTSSSCGATQRLPDCVDEPPPKSPHLEIGGDPVLLAAGDIVDEDMAGAEATAALLDHYDGHVATLGDNLNTRGQLEDALSGYARTWGRHRWRTRPAVGNHDYMTAHGAAYYAYFCGAAGTPFEGWYSYELGAWHVVVLNSMCAELYADGEGPACGDGSPQLRWLEADLAAHPSRCTLAYWHHPRFSSDVEGDKPALRAAWELLYRAGAEVILNGHVHAYERFAPLTPDGDADEARGIRQFIVGTGGASLVPPDRRREHSEVQLGGIFGIARFTLHAASYDWQLIGADGVIHDAGSGSCH